MRRFVSAYINSCSICTTEDNIVYSILFDYLYIYTFIIYLIIKSFNDKTLLYRSRNTILHHLSNTNSILCSPHSPQDISGKKNAPESHPILLDHAPCLSIWYSPSHFEDRYQSQVQNAIDHLPTLIPWCGARNCWKSLVVKHGALLEKTLL